LLYQVLPRQSAISATIEPVGAENDAPANRYGDDVAARRTDNVQAHHGGNDRFHDLKPISTDPIDLNTLFCFGFSSCFYF